MKIAQIALVNVSVPPEKYGGTELVISQLTEELVRRGHEVTLYATGDSHTTAKLKSIYPKAVGFGNDTPEMQHNEVSCAFKDAAQFDVIHNHANFWGLKAARGCRTPVVTTMHNDYLLPGTKEHQEYKNVGSFVAISQNQKQRLKGLNYAGVVYNAVEADKFPFEAKKDGFLLFFSNLIKEKGVEVAVKAAKELGLKLIMSGKVNPGEQQEFFDKNVGPYIDNKQIVLHGLVDVKTKVAFLSKAKCLLFPISWHEPFGIVMAEAMACGTPVVAYRHGSVPEVVEDGKTGYVVDSYEELLQAVQKVDKISPKVCRQHVIDNFSIKRMVDGYEEIYRRISNA